MRGKIFNAQEVQAIIAGNKTQFREVIKPKPLIRKNDDYLFDDKGKLVFQKECCPYQVGQKIFCKESFFEDLTYRKFAGFEAKDDLLEINARHMKQEHSRLALQIKEIRVERLADVSEEDAIKEGIPLSEEFKNRYYTPENNYAVPKIAFMRWWNATHKKPEEKWEANPWVWSISFEVVK